MNSRQLHLWCLFDIRSQKVIEGLLFDEARAVVSSLATEEVEHWWAWRDDWADWQPVSGVEGLTEIIYRAAPTKYPELPTGSQQSNRELAPQGLYIPREIKVETTQVESENENSAELSNVTFTVRSKRRFKKRCTVSIEIAGQKFQTFTQDISVGGLNLEEPLPAWVGSEFKVRIGKLSSKKQIELKCCLVEENNDDRRRLRILPLQRLEDEKALELWMAAA